MDSFSLTKTFGISDQIKFETTEEGLILIHIENQFSKASFCLQGGQLLSWIKKDQIKNNSEKASPDLIWLSEEAVFSKGRSIRGGSPICWPWFGAHPTEKDFPTHGYARTQPWKMIETKLMSDGGIFFSLKLIQDAVKREHRLEGAELELHVTVGDKLELVLISKNRGDKSIIVGGAFHTYFNISDIGNIKIEGLEDQVFIDTLDEWKDKKESASIKIEAEIDRIYQDNPANDNVIVDQGFDRKIRIRKKGSHSTVVWNPWIEKSARLGDMGMDGYKKMVCVETTNAVDDLVTISPGGEHRLSVCYSLEHI